MRAGTTTGIVSSSAPTAAAVPRIFGDESASYADALKRHYEQRPPPDWQQDYVSAYATMPPVGRTWAETWRFLHVLDAARDCNLAGLPWFPSAATSRRLRPPTT